MFIGELKTKGVFKIRIDLAGAFKGVPAKDDQPEIPGDPDLAEVYTGQWVVTREPRGDEVFKVQAGDGVQTSATYMALFPDCLIDWSFERSENEKASKEEALEILRASSTLWAYVLAKWGEALPLARRSRKA